MRRTKKNAVYCCLELTLLPTVWVRATQETTTLDDITIKGRKIEERRLSAELANYGHKVETVTAKEIKRGGFADVNQVLESPVPGLYVSTKTGASR